MDLENFREYWKSKILSTQRIDKRTCVDGVLELYRSAGLQAPKKIILVSSPLALRLAFVSLVINSHRMRKAPEIYNRERQVIDLRNIALDKIIDYVSDPENGVLVNLTDKRDPIARFGDYLSSETISNPGYPVVQIYLATNNSDHLGMLGATIKHRMWGRMFDDFEQYKKIRKIYGRKGTNLLHKSFEYMNLGNAGAYRDIPIFFFAHTEKPKDNFLLAWEFLAEHGGPRITFTDFCIISDRPKALFFDNENQFHNDNGPACEWEDGCAIYIVHGIPVPPWIIRHPEKITSPKIDAERNVEIRRIMLERYGIENYLDNINTEILDTSEYGVLLRKEVWNDEPVVAVKVTNSTAEPDGTYKEYFIRVPPWIKTAKQAVAWTFGMTPEEYFITNET